MKGIIVYNFFCYILKELMYIWNSFPMIAKSRELTQNILCYVNNVYSSLEDAKGNLILLASPLTSVTFIIIKYQFTEIF